MSAPARIVVELYQTPKPLLRIGRRAQRWRWRAKNAGNGRVLAVSSEAYTNVGDAEKAILQLFGFSAVTRRRAGRPDVVLREAS